MAKNQRPGRYSPKKRTPQQMRDSRAGIIAPAAERPEPPSATNYLDEGLMGKRVSSAADHARDANDKRLGPLLGTDVYLTHTRRLIMSA